MPRFAVYFVPDAASKFYEYGSSVLGYDVRTGQPVSLLPRLQEQLPTFNEEWVKNARPFGFHLTIGDAIHFNPGAISQIERELDDLLGCFGPEYPFVLRQRQGKPVSVWGKNGEVIVLPYDANQHLVIFHSLVVARVNVLGNGSGYLTEYLASPQDYADKPHVASRVRKFYSPYVLSRYRPHFTLLNPYSGGDHDTMIKVLSETFADFSEIEVTSICLLIQMHDDHPWRIHREFQR